MPDLMRQSPTDEPGSCNRGRKAICFATEAIGPGPNSTEPRKELPSC